MDDLEARREALAKALKAKQEANDAPRTKESDYALLSRYSADFISGPIVGGIMGYACDTAFNTTPWGIIIFVLLGFAAGIFNLIRSSRQKNG